MADQPRPVWLTQPAIKVLNDMESRLGPEHMTLEELRALDTVLTGFVAAPADATEAVVPVLFDAEANTPGIVITDRPLAEARCRRDAHAVLRALGIPDA